MPEKTTRKIRDPDATQARILAAAKMEFARSGLGGARVDGIADRAKANKRMSYHYFGNKEDLFWATAYAVLERLDEYLLVAMQGVSGAAAKLRACSLAYAGFFEANPQYLEVFVQERAEFRGAATEALVEYHEKLIRRLAVPPVLHVALTQAQRPSA